MIDVVGDVDHQQKIKGLNVWLMENRQWRRLITLFPAVLMTLLSIKYYLHFHGFLETRSVLCEACQLFFQQNQENFVDSALPNTHAMVDIISVGSLLKEPFQQAQQRTFGGHVLVRNFFRVTERTDIDRECFTELTNDQIDEIENFCHKGQHVSKFAYKFRKMVFYPKKNAGWMCAQKRPIDGLYNVLQQYKHDAMELPQYLFIIDDDTYINMDSLSKILFKTFPAEIPNVVSGCVFDFFRGFHFPYGGFGSFLSRAAIQRLLQPIYCNDRNAEGSIADPFTRYSCWRLSENLMGEKDIFTEGMSIADLMNVFSSSQPFADVRRWKTGYCFHSDHALAYFFNFYHIAVPESELEANFRVTDSLRKKYMYKELTNNYESGRKGECRNEKDKCTADNPICHYIVPSQMDALYQDVSKTI
jgi:hypothetical protein